MTPEPVELELPDGSRLRGSAWRTTDHWTLLIHEPGPEHDIDDLTSLAGAVVRSGSSAVAFDLPGHGFSDGEWEQTLNQTALIERMLDWVGYQQPAKVGILAVGAGCYPALELARKRRLDIAVLVSPTPSSALEAFPRDFRGDGAAKLLVFGGADEEYRETATELRRRSIGWAVSLSVGTVDQGTVLVSGPLGARVQEGTELFLREQWVIGRRRDAQARSDAKELTG